MPPKSRLALHAGDLHPYPVMRSRRGGRRGRRPPPAASATLPAPPGPRRTLGRRGPRRWQPRVREQARRQAAASAGVIIDTRAWFGFTAALGSTDNARIRHLTVALPPAFAARLFDAQQAGASEQQLREITAEGLGEAHFRDGGRRAHGLEVEFTDVEQLDFDL